METKDEKELISLNSNILNEMSIEELEERLELSSWTCDCTTQYGCGGCYTSIESCPTVNLPPIIPPITTPGTGTGPIIVTIPFPR